MNKINFIKEITSHAADVNPVDEEQGEVTAYCWPHTWPANWPPPAPVGASQHEEAIARKAGHGEPDTAAPSSGEPSDGGPDSANPAKPKE
jgi:hypothetical protein